MRTTKRFTPKVVTRFEREGRGTGVYEDYLPWHRVSRGDPASQGRSHLVMWRGRLRELLSDGELGQQLFATMLPHLDDCLEQFKLSLEHCPHLLSLYGWHASPRNFPGTVQLAQELGMRHPKLCEGAFKEFWRLTTDLVLVFKPPSAPRHLLALAFKPANWVATRRKLDLLRLEREFWARRGVPWLLITPALYDERVVLTLRRTGCWALGDEAALEQRRIATSIALSSAFDSLTNIQERIGRSTGSIESAQRALWQAVWRGELPVDLRRGWRPSHPLTLLSPAQYRELNPIWSRRSSWN